MQNRLLSNIKEQLLMISLSIGEVEVFWTCRNGIIFRALAIIYNSLSILFGIDKYLTVGLISLG